MDFKKLLQDNNLRITEPRLIILEKLFNIGEPVSIDALEKKINKKMDISTLYRSLKKMVDTGILYQTDFREGKAFFEYQRHHHHHIVCTSCGIKESVDFCIEKEIKNISTKSKKFNIVKNHSLEFFSTCKKCLV